VLRGPEARDRSDRGWGGDVAPAGACGGATEVEVPLELALLLGEAGGSKGETSLRSPRGVVDPAASALVRRSITSPQRGQDLASYGREPLHRGQTICVANCRDLSGEFPRPVAFGESIAYAICTRN
jgi:hypothetical protein